MEITWMNVTCAIASAVGIPLLLHHVLCNKTKLQTVSLVRSGFIRQQMIIFYDYYDNHGRNTLDTNFQAAVDFCASNTNNKMTNEQKLTLYALYKQAHFGRCSSARPSAIDMVGIVKWESWRALGDMSQEMAKQQYFESVQTLFTKFNVIGSQRCCSMSASEATKDSVSLDSHVSMTGAVSIPKVDMSSEDWKVNEDVFHYASTGEKDKLLLALDNGEDINAQDLEGRTMLHWAVDRDQQSVVVELLHRQASPNIQDVDGMTPLHYATSCEHEKMAQLLVKHGALVDVKDLDGDTPLMTLVVVANIQMRTLKTEVEKGSV